MVSFSGPFSNGDTISYDFIASRSPDLILDLGLPTGMNLFGQGIDTAGQSVIYSGIILFGSNCTVIPEIEEGDAFGWTMLVSPKVRLR